MSKLFLIEAVVSAQQRQPGMLEALLPLIVIFFIFYFLLIRPQQKRLKAHRKFLEKLEKGQKVVTTGGIIGEVVGITDRVVTLDVGGGVKIKVVKEQIASPYRQKSEQSS